MNVHVHIEKLILDGLPLSAAQGPRVGQAIQAELARLLAEGGVPAHLGSSPERPVVSAPGITVGQPGAGRPAEWGNRIARSVYRGLQP